MATQEEIDLILAIAEERLGERERAVKAREEALSEGGPKTLRDYFAGQALPAIIAYGLRNPSAFPADATGNVGPAMCTAAYLAADDMLVARLK